MCGSAFYSFFLSLCFALLGQPYPVKAGQVNITVDDTDPSIIYEPIAAWFLDGNTSNCAVCLTRPSLSIAYNDSWHYGLHIMPILNTNISGREVGDGASVKGTLKSNDLSGERRAASIPSCEFPVSVQFNFTGSAIYLFSILPFGIPPNADSTPTLMNLTFTLDSEPAGNFLHSGSASIQDFQSNISVFSRGGLSDSAHTLLVNLGPNSVFLFDYYVVSRADSSNSGPPTPSQASTTDANKAGHDIRTFAGAVGGSLSVLATVSACLAFSIYWRRRRSARRQMRDRERQVESESSHSDVSGNSPSMRGPAPFVPRFFPGTVPAAPPPYVAPAEGFSIMTPSNLPSVGLPHQPPPPFQSTPLHLAPAALLPLVTQGADPSNSPPPFFAASPPSLPVLTSAIPRTAQQVFPPGYTEDPGPASLEVTPILPTAAAFPSSRLTRISRQSRSSSLPNNESATTTSLPSAPETQPLETENEARVTNQQAESGHGVVLDT